MFKLHFIHTHTLPKMNTAKKVNTYNNVTYSLHSQIIYKKTQGKYVKLAKCLLTEISTNWTRILTAY